MTDANQMIADEHESDAGDTGDEIRIGISTCLLGESVRFDGGHKRDRFLTDTVSRFVRFIPVCPEVELGLGVPRKTLRLEKDGPDSRLVMPSDGADLTERMRTFAEERTSQLESLDLSGYILKSKSPSCGMERVKVWSNNQPGSKSGVGHFARVLLEKLPYLPVEEEGRLCDPILRENFFERVFAHRRLQDLFAGDWSLGQLVEFHSQEKLLLLAHHPATYKSLGQLVAGGKDLSRAELEDRYRRGHQEGMSHRATRGRHINVLQHMAGFVSDQVSEDERRDLTESIEEYGRRLIPRIVPLTLIRHLARRFDSTWLLGQHYLIPHAKELMLTNHV